MDLRRRNPPEAEERDRTLTTTTDEEVGVDFETLHETVGVNDLYEMLVTTDWTNVSDVRDVAKVTHRFYSAASTIREFFDKSVQEGWATGKFSAVEVPTIRNPKGEKIPPQAVNLTAKSKM